MIKIIGLTHAEYSIINPFWWDEYELGFCDQTGKIFRKQVRANPRHFNGGIQPVNFLT